MLEEYKPERQKGATYKIVLFSKDPKKTIEELKLVENTTSMDQPGIKTTFSVYTDKDGNKLQIWLMGPETDSQLRYRFASGASMILIDEEFTEKEQKAYAQLGSELGTDDVRVSSMEKLAKKGSLNDLIDSIEKSFENKRKTSKA